MPPAVGGPSPSIAEIGPVAVSSAVSEGDGSDTIVGSVVGGFIGYLIGHDKQDGAFQLSGLFGSIIGAIIVLLVYKAVTGRNNAAVRR